MIFHTAGNKEKKIFIMNKKQKLFDAVGWKSYCNTKKCCIVELGVLALGAGRAGAGRAGRARVLGVQGARGRWECVGRHGRRRATAGGSAAAGRVSVRGHADGRGRTVGRAGGRRADGRQRRARRAQKGLQARGLGAWVGQDWALGAPDLIFKPVFDSVFFLSQ